MTMKGKVDFVTNPEAKECERYLTDCTSVCS